eukprot:m51a1_g1304 hypothetical protein (319) ;mRNA; r:204641-205597
MEGKAPRRPLAHFLEDCASWQPPGQASWSIRGLSRGSMRTGFVGDGLLRDVLFDAGVNTYRTPRAVLLTHTHSDHCAALADVLTGVPRDVPLLAPAGALGPLRAYFRGQACAADCTEQPDMCAATGLPSRFARVQLAGAGGGRELPLGFGSLRVLAHDLSHTVPSCAYTVLHERAVLKPALRGLPGREIARRRAAGEDVSDTESEPLLTFFGDTGPAGVRATLEALGGAGAFPRVVVVECTWLGGAEAAAGEDGGHCAWGDLEGLLAASPAQTTWMLTHFSRRYDDAEVRAFFAQRAQGLPNVWLWLHDGPVAVSSLQ